MSVSDEIQRLAAEAAQLCEQWEPDVDDEEVWDKLHEGIEKLDQRADRGVAVGKYIRFSVADGQAVHIIDEIRDQVVHCIWIANIDDRQADAVDDDGWCLRSIAERNIVHRE